LGSYNTIDPVEIEARFALEDSLAYLGTIFTEPSPESLEKVERVREIMDGLPPREADFVELYFFRQLRQIDIATIFGVSQPTVCYRLKRAAKRIRFLLDLPDIDLEIMRVDLIDVLPAELDVDIVILMYQTTCQSEVASQLGVSQGLVRHRFLRAIKIMDRIPKYETYSKICHSVIENLNILREIPRSDSEEGLLRMVH
jgi:DNA-directed RNA polymerase specialized sigma subunit, sigma24 homolog